MFAYVPRSGLEAIALGGGAFRRDACGPGTIGAGAWKQRACNRGKLFALLTLAACASLQSAAAFAQSGGIVQSPDAPWADDANVRAVLAQRQRGIEAMTSGRISAESERYSTTMVANTPNGSVVPGAAMLEIFEQGSFGYAHVEQHIEYAGSHGPDIVVLMGEEIVVPMAGSANAGQRIRRRFTDVFRRENGEWRHDVRHANVVAIED